MDILFHSPDEDAAAWKAELEAALPGAQMRVWQPGDDGPADYAMVWLPPREMLAHRTDIKAIFNLGAGVDAILRYRDALPPGVMSLLPPATSAYRSTVRQRQMPG